jgi:hypothetical protein
MPPRKTDPKKRATKKAVKRTVSSRTQRDLMPLEEQGIGVYPETSQAKMRLGEDNKKPEKIMVVVGTGEDIAIQALSEVFEDALNLAASKNASYGDAWRRQGWMGNFARIHSKTSRLKNMIWRDDKDLDGADKETIEDTLLDLINLAGFMMINRTDRNKWGDG